MEAVGRWRGGATGSGRPPAQRNGQRRTPVQMALNESWVNGERGFEAGHGLWVGIEAEQRLRPAVVETMNVDVMAANRTTTYPNPKRRLGFTISAFHESSLRLGWVVSSSPWIKNLSVLFAYA